MFAWGKNAHETFLIACIATEVNHWSIPEVFIRRHHFDWHEMRSAVSPLRVFNAGIPPEDWFREDICFMLLQMLDFRRKPVQGVRQPHDVDAPLARGLDRHCSLQ